MPDNIISTPFPRPLYEYELGLVTKADDRSVSSIWGSSPASPLSLPRFTDATYVNCLMRSVAILDQASKLVYLEPEAGREEAFEPSLRLPLDLRDTSLPFEQYQIASGDIAGMPHTEHVDITGSANGNKQTARLRTPKAYEQIKLALDSLELDLSPEFRTDWQNWDRMAPKWLHSSTSTRNLCTLVRKPFNPPFNCFSDHSH